jgi:HSP20 family protein
MTRRRTTRCRPAAVETFKEIQMAFDMQNWNPFKFSRHSEARQHAGASAPQEQAGDWPDAARLLRAVDPFNLVPGLLRSPLGGAANERWFGNFSPAAFQPRIDVVDDGDALRVTAEVPGMDKQDLELVIEDGYLVLRGEKRIDAKKEEKGCYRLERAFGGFQRVLPLPDGVDVERAEARFDKGELTLRLPKKAGGANASRKLEIK